MIKKQESSPNRTVGKSFEKNYILHGYHICVHHEGTICKNLSLFFYLTKQYFYELIVCYMHFNNYFVEHIRGDMRWEGGHHVNIK